MSAQPKPASRPFVRLLDRLTGQPMHLVTGLLVLCVFLAVGDLLYHRHATIAVEGWPLFYPVFGFAVYVAVIFAAKALRLVIRRPEAYYGPCSTDAETPNEHMTGGGR